MLAESELINELAREFDLPVISQVSHIRFFRTQAGMYYSDFFINQYIALGWDQISADLIFDDQLSNDQKKAVISEWYPQEKRPGLILSQMRAFYCNMQLGDLVVIPDAGAQRVAIGILGDFVAHIHRENITEDYEKCEYRHKRSVKWLKQVDLRTDVYLFKIMRGQQTISDITMYAELVYRNLHPCYVAQDGLHLMLHKMSSADYRIKSNIDLQISVLEINRLLGQHYNCQDECEKIIIKTAVGSPGFIEIILPYIPVSVFTAIFVYRGIIGKVKGSDCAENTGLMAIITKGNELINDHIARQRTAAEIRQIEANTNKTMAETAQIQALTRKTLAEAAAIEAENERDRATAIAIAEKMKILNVAAKESGISFDKQLDEAG